MYISRVCYHIVCKSLSFSDNAAIPTSQSDGYRVVWLEASKQVYSSGSLYTKICPYYSRSDLCIWQTQRQAVGGYSDSRPKADPITSTPPNYTLTALISRGSSYRPRVHEWEWSVIKCQLEETHRGRALITPPPLPPSPH